MLNFTVVELKLIAEKRGILGYKDMSRKQIDALYCPKQYIFR